jgi:Reverse transcriptase (RNA-dependent DNA polymerase)
VLAVEFGRSAWDFSSRRVPIYVEENNNGSGRELTVLNSNPRLDLKHCLDNLPTLDPEDNLYNTLNIVSDFYDVDSFVCKFKKTKVPIFLSLNAQSINAKHDSLVELCNIFSKENLPISIIAIQETWNVKYANLLDLPGFQRLIFKNRTVGRGGGVGIYVKNGLTCKVIEPPFRSFINKIFESITLEITDSIASNCKHYTVTNIYRSPSAINGINAADQIDEFFNKMEQLFDYLNSLKKKSYVFLDSNINLLDMGINQQAANYFNLICNSGFVNTNLKATRMQKNCNSLIDNILTNDKSSCMFSGSIINDISDHWMTFLVPNSNTKQKKVKTPNIKKRLVTDRNLKNLQDSLKNLQWQDVLGANNVNECYDLFWDNFKMLYDMHIPLVNVRFNRNKHKINGFMTGGLMVSRNTKITLLKKSLIEPTEQNILKYKTYRNLYNKIVRVAKKVSTHERLEKCKKNPKKTWDILGEFIGKGKNNSKIQSISVAGTEYTDSRDMATQFNKFFSSVGEQISSTVEQTNANFTDYLKEYPNLIPLEFGPISQAEFITIINNLESKSSTDINGISNKMLKFLKFELATPLVHLFNLSLINGDFPDKLKVSRTVPIFKAGDPSSCDNYRPISLLSSISKVLEKAVAMRLMNHLKYNKILSEDQFGFQEGVSTVHHLLKLVNHVTKELNKKNFTVAIFLDLKKAFDVVPHKILLKKLEKMGITGVSLRWFTNYLKGRSQQVEVDGVLSDIEYITISVLQGSILGPILFLCFINDLTNCTDLLTLLFADDTAGVTSGPELKPLIAKANLELQKLSTWFRANKMAVNVSKTKYIVFKPKNKKVVIGKNEGVLFNNNDINGPTDNSKIFELDRIFNDNPNPQDRSFKLLGVYLDENLSFDQHCNHVCNKLARSTYIICKIKNQLPKKSLRTLYFALFHSHLLYCLPIYSCTSMKNLNRITIMQKKVIRAISNEKYNAHTKPLFNMLNILPFDKLITLTKSTLTHSVIHKYGPAALHDQWTFNADRNRNLELRNEHDLYIPMATSEQVKKLPFFSFANSWNNLIYDRLNPNPMTFKLALLNFLKQDQ